MRVLTLPISPTKTYGLISIDIREKVEFLSLPSLLRHSPALTPNGPYVFFFFFYFSFFFFYFIFILLFFIFLIFFPYFIFPISYKCTICHAMCHPTPDASKNMKFRLSQNLTKFDGVTRFHETNSKVKSVSSS